MTTQLTPEQRAEMLDNGTKLNELSGEILELAISGKIGKEQGVEVAARLMATQQYIHDQVIKHQNTDEYFTR